MNKKILIPTLLLSLVLSGCALGPSDGGNNGDNGGGQGGNPGGEQGGIATLEQAITAIRTNHNYTLTVSSYVESEPSEVYNDIFRNFDDNAYFSQQAGYQVGFIKQADQGYVSAQYAAGVIVPDYFFSANINKGISEIYDFVGENALEGTFTLNSSTNLYECTDVSSIGMACILSGWETSLMEAPEKMTATMQNGNLVINAVPSMYYFDESEIKDPLHITLTFSNIGTTSDANITNYIANPTSIFEVRTDWTTYEKGLFNKYFNGYLPHFVTNSGATLWVGTIEHYSGMRIGAEDFTSGDQTNTYGNLLKSEGFVESATVPGKYTKKVDNDDGTITYTYNVELKYFAPTDEYDGYAVKDHTYADYSANGKMSYVFYYSSASASPVKTVSELNAYLTNNGYSSRVPLMTFTDEDCGRISGFFDKTSTDPDSYFFYTGTAAFKLFFKTLDAAKTGLNSYGQALEAMGYEKQGGPFGGSFIYRKGESVVYITDMSAYSSWIANVNYASMSFKIYLEDGDDEGQTPTTGLSHITLSGMTTTYEVGDTFSFDGVCTAHYLDKADAVVTPTSVSSPNMSSEGIKSVTVTYSEGGVTKSAIYSITVNAKQGETPSEPVLTLNRNADIASYEFLNSGNQPITTFNPKVEDTFYMTITTKTGYIVTSLEVLEDPNAICEYDGTSYRWSITITDKTITSITVTAITDVGGNSITLDTVTGGSLRVIIPHDYSNVPAGTMVAFGATASDGYELVSVSIKDHPEIEISSNPMSQTSFSFEMPDFAVTITAEFKKIEGEEQGGSNVDLSNDPLVNYGTMKASAESGDAKYTFSFKFNGDGTGTLVITYKVLFEGNSTATYSFNWSKSLKEGHTYNINLTNVTKTGSTGASADKIRHNPSQIDSLTVKYNNAETDVAELRCGVTFDLNGETMHETFVY